MIPIIATVDKDFEPVAVNLTYDDPPVGFANNNRELESDTL